MKTKTSKIYADISHTIPVLGEDGENRVTYAKNMIYGKGDFLTSRAKYYQKKYASAAINGAGMHNGKIFHIHKSTFYYDGSAKFGVSGYQKRFYVCGDIILIYPDLVYYNAVTGKYGKMGKETGVITYKVMHREENGENIGLCCLHSDDISLTGIFEVGDKILVTNKEYSIDGYHTVTEVDTENDYLLFRSFDFGDGEEFSLVGNLSSGSPLSCDCMCVCSDRVWMIADGKIYASGKGNPLDWQVKISMPWSFEASMDMIDKIHFCTSFGDRPVLFSENRIYAVEGSDAFDYRIECICDGEGLLPSLADTVSYSGGELVFMTRRGIVYFDGSNMRRVEDLPFSVDGSTRIIGICNGALYYLSVLQGTTGKLYVYDSNTKMWYYTVDELFIKFFKHDGQVFGNTTTGIYAFTDNCSLAGFYKDNSPHVDVKIAINTKGKRLLRVVLDCDTGAENNLNVKILRDGESVYTQALEKSLSGEHKILLLPRECSRLEIQITGYDTFTLRHAYAEVLE